MASPSRFLAAVCLSLVYGTAPARSEGAEGPPVLSVTPALEYYFETEAGRVYELQGSADGAVWETVEGPLFGDGTPAKGFLSGEAAARRLPHYRIHELDPASVGPAPEKLESLTLVFNDDGEPRQFIFFQQGHGMLKTDAIHARAFKTVVKRTAADRLEVKLEYRDGSTALLNLRFLEDRLGTARWEQRDAAGEMEFSDAGPFSLHTGRLPEAPVDAALPDDLTGTSLLFTEAGRSTRLEFSATGEVTVRSEGAAPVTFPYLYELESLKSGIVQLERPDGTAVEYELHLKGPASGSFEKREIPAGGGAPPVSAPSSEGNFSLPAEPAPPKKPNCPPPDLKGHSFYLAGSDPVTLHFNKDGSGNAVRHANGAAVITPFLYNYARSGNASATLTLIFHGPKDDLIEDYALNFNDNCGGSYERSEFEGGQFTSRDGGVFDQSIQSPSARAKLRLGLAW